MPLASLTFLAECNGPADFGVHWFREAHLALAPFGVAFNESNLGLGTAFKETDPEVPFWQVFEGHSPFLMMTVALVELLLERLLSLGVLLSDEILGVLSSTDLLTGTLDLESSLAELAREAGEFFTEAYFSLGEDPRPGAGPPLGGAAVGGRGGGPVAPCRADGRERRR